MGSEAEWEDPRGRRDTAREPRRRLDQASCESLSNARNKQTARTRYIVKIEQLHYLRFVLQFARSQ